MTIIAAPTARVPERGAVIIGVLGASERAVESQILGEDERNEVLAALDTLQAPSTREAVTRIVSPGHPQRQILAVSLGENPSLHQLRECVGAALRSSKLPEDVVVDIPHGDAEEFLAIAEGALLGSYRFTRYRSSAKSEASNLTILTAVEGASALLEKARVLAEAQNAVRDLVNTPAGDLRTVELADAAAQMATGTGVSVQVWDEDRLKEAGCGGLLGVGAGSDSPSRMVRLAWEPEAAERSVALVGKGITFDSGGMSLKTHAGLLDMKTDMTGAATVAAVVVAAAKLQLPVKVTAWMCIAENMLSGTATRLGDVLTIADGTTVEVTNTDAEGRLVLADGLTHAVRENPDEVIDVATLTGAQIVALGGRYAGLMGTEDLTARLTADASVAGELMWPMPLPSYLRKSLDSNIADMKNSGSRFGGMLVAGLFLKEFVGETPWAHIDIAGPSYNTEEPWGYTAKGATGFAVRTLLKHLGA
ncbi:leucyl aminopeptidase [Actinomycetaceae bacterium L2_0104]